MISTQDKGWWVEAGLAKEHDFVERILPALGIEGEINPAKEHDPYAPDLLVGGRLADLKSQRHPFFTASRYGIDPQYAVTFNVKDLRRYIERYPLIDLFFWVDWHEVSGFGTTVEPLVGVWRAWFPTIERLALNGTAKLHAYQQRQDDTRGNAKASYVFDVRYLTYLDGSHEAVDSHRWEDE
jgi:hypothetical protein